MKKTTLQCMQAAAATMLIGAACSQAQAQTSVTIYGRVDAGVDYQSSVALKDANGNLTGQTGGKLAA